MSLITPSFTTLPSPTPAYLGTTAAPAITTSNPSILGWISVSAENGTPIYSSATCSLGLTFSASNTYAACCSVGASSDLYTSCQDSTMLVGATQVNTCALGEVCKTDTVYQTAVDANPTLDVYCGPQGPENTWFRQMPTSGLAWAGQNNEPNNDANNGANNNTSNSSNHSLIAKIGAGIGSVVVLLIFGGILLWCCAGCVAGGITGGGGGGGGSGGGGGHRPRTPPIICGCCGCDSQQCSHACCGHGPN